MGYLANGYVKLEFMVVLGIWWTCHTSGCLGHQVGASSTYGHANPPLDMIGLSMEVNMFGTRQRVLYSRSWESLQFVIVTIREDYPCTQIAQLWTNEPQNNVGTILLYFCLSVITGSTSVSKFAYRSIMFIRHLSEILTALQTASTKTH